MIWVLLGVDEFDPSVSANVRKAGLRIKRRVLSSQAGIEVLTGMAEPHKLSAIRAVSNVIYFDSIPKGLWGGIMGIFVKTVLKRIGPLVIPIIVEVVLEELRKNKKKNWTRVSRNTRFTRIIGTFACYGSRYWFGRILRQSWKEKAEEKDRQYWSDNWEESEIMKILFRLTYPIWYLATLLLGVAWIILSLPIGWFAWVTTGKWTFMMRCFIISAFLNSWVHDLMFSKNEVQRLKDDWNSLNT